MQTVSNKFREQAYSGEALYLCNLSINNVAIPIEQIASIKIDSPIIDNSTETFYIGSFISQTIKIKFRNLDGLDIQSGYEVSLEIGQNIYDEQTQETTLENVPIGVYLIDELAENYQETCEITCMDFAVKFKPNIDYSPCFTNGTATTNTIINYICDYFGIEIGTDITQLPNGNVVVGTYDNSISGKQWLSYLAEIKGCNLKMSRDGKLLFLPFKKTTPDITINALESAKWELGEKFEISQVIYFDAVRNFTFGEGTENTLYIRQDNPFITDETVVENIYNNVNGMVVYSLKTKNYGDISLDAWDLIQFNLGYDENNNLISYQTYNNNMITYEMNIVSEINAQIPTKQQQVTTNVIGGDETTKIRMIKTLLDYVNAQVTLQAEEQQILTNRLTQLILDVNSIQSIFQMTGGNNLIKNSQFLLTDVTWEFMELNAKKLIYDDKKIKYDNKDIVYKTANVNLKYHTEIGEGYNGNMVGLTVSPSEVKLRNIVAKTKEDNIIDLKKGNKYSLNYFFKQDTLTTTRVQLIEKISGNCAIDTNTQLPIDVTYNNATNNITEQSFQFIAEDTSYILKVTTETSTGNENNGFFYLYDLILNSGEKKSWEPAASEVYSTVLQMSQQGLKVISTGSKTITMLEAEGLQIKQWISGKIGEVITKFTNKGLVTEIAETKEIHINNYVMTEITINNQKHHIEYFKN